MKPEQQLCICVAVIIAVVHGATGRSRGCATTLVNIRSGPSSVYSQVGALFKGQCVPFIGLSSSGKWAQVIYSGKVRNHTVGWWIAFY